MNDVQITKQNSSMGNRTVFKKMFFLASPYWGWYTLLAIITFFTSLIPVGMGEGMRQLINAAITGNHVELRTGILLLTFVMLIDILGDFGRGYISRRLSNTSILNLQHSVLRHLFTMPFSQFMQWHTGDKLQRINDSTISAQDGLNQRIPSMLGNLFEVIFLFIYLSWISGSLLIGTLIITILFPTMTNFFGRFIRKYQDHVNQSQSAQDSLLLDQLQGAEVVRAFGLRGTFNYRWKRMLETTRQYGLRLWLWQTVMGTSAELSYCIGLLYILSLGSWMYFQGTIEIGILAAFLVTYDRISFPLSIITGTWGAIQNAFAHGRRIFEMADPTVPIHKQALSQELPVGIQNLELKKLSFSYTRNTEIIKNLTLTIEGGKTTAIVGPSGGGKSTLLKLILGLQLQQTGEIHYGSVPISECNLKLLLQRTAYVPQDTTLFATTIRENIRYGNQEAGNEAVEYAAKLANATSFIEQLSDGYDTLLGERGVQLSGGERQRIIIARALLRNPDLLLLDEPTSALDSTNDEQVLSAINTLMKDRTVLVIAHRLQTIRNADRIIFFADGQVIESGSYDSLMQLDGRFASLVRSRDTNDSLEGGALLE